MATVVFVDSNPSVLELAEEALRDGGHHVLVTADAWEVQALTGTVRVDLVVGERGHFESLRQAGALPRLLAIVDADETAPTAALRKPFSLTELVDAVARALES